MLFILAGTKTEAKKFAKTAGLDDSAWLYVASEATLRGFSDASYVVTGTFWTKNLSLYLHRAVLRAGFSQWVNPSDRCARCGKEAVEPVSIGRGKVYCLMCTCHDCSCELSTSEEGQCGDCLEKWDEMNNEETRPDKER